MWEGIEEVGSVPPVRDREELRRKGGREVWGGIGGNGGGRRRERGNEGYWVGMEEWRGGEGMGKEWRICRAREEKEEGIREGNGERKEGEKGREGGRERTVVKCWPIFP